MVDRIFALMEKRGVKPTKLADALGVGEATISNWKSGRQKPSTMQLSKSPNTSMSQPTIFLKEKKTLTPTLLPYPHQQSRRS